MIQVYLQQNKLAKCRAVQVYADGRPSRHVDFQYLADGRTLDPTICHGSIINRYAAGEAIEEHAYPNECYPAPEVNKPKRWCKEQILILEATPPYYVSRYDEEVYNALYEDQKAGFYVRCKKVITLKIDLRAIVTADPSTWTTGQQEALQVRIEEILGWAN